jgi:allantoinase
MPLNSIPPTTTVEGLRAKEEAARGKLTVDLGLWGGIIPTNLKDLAPLAEAGVCGYKLFLIESGVEEFPCVNEEQMRAAMLEIKAKAPELPVLVHAEACACDAAKALLEAHKGRDEKEYQNYLESRPPVWEEDAIRIALRLAQETQARCHIVHLSAAEALPQFREARAQGRDNVSLETCPHYLTLTADTIPAGATAYKCAPPIRGKDNQKALWAALRDGTIPMIVSDHSPCEPSLKCLESGSFAQSWGGISSLQLGLPLIFSELRAQALDGEDGGEEKGKFDLAKTVHQIHEWMSAAPARFVRFAHRKGGLFPGADADLVAFDPDGAVLVAKEMIQHRHKLTPYLGRSLGAAVRHTFVRGNEVFTATDVAGAPVKFSPQPLGERVYPQSHPKEVARLIDQK